MPREDVSFDSHGTEVAAWLYRPEAIDQVPCVVMAHGFSGTRDAGLEPFAERFAAEGFAVLLFDYRFFGASGGEPRQLLRIPRQLEDWQAAIRFARGHEAVDARQIALWGSSFSGGHVVAAAAADGDIQAVIAQVPFMDGLATLRAIGPGHGLKAVAHGLRDGVRALTGREPHLVPAVAPVGGPFGVMQQPGNYDGFVEIARDSATWRNEVSGRVLLEFATYRPGRKASKIRCPVLFLAGDVDNLTPAGATKRAAASAPSGRLIVLPCGHFEPYVGEVFERNIEEQVKFLTGVLDRPAALAAT